jgi:hypothetical protein
VTASRMSSLRRPQPHDAQYTQHRAELLVPLRRRQELGAPRAPPASPEMTVAGATRYPLLVSYGGAGGTRARNHTARRRSVRKGHTALGQHGHILKEKPPRAFGQQIGISSDHGPVLYRLLGGYDVCAAPLVGNDPQPLAALQYFLLARLDERHRLGVPSAPVSQHDRGALG